MGVLTRSSSPKDLGSHAALKSVLLRPQMKTPCARIGRKVAAKKGRASNGSIPAAASLAPAPSPDLMPSLPENFFRDFIFSLLRPSLGDSQKVLSHLLPAWPSLSPLILHSGLSRPIEITSRLFPS